MRFMVGGGVASSPPPLPAEQSAGGESSAPVLIAVAVAVVLGLLIGTWVVMRGMSSGQRPAGQTSAATSAPPAQPNLAARDEAAYSQAISSSDDQPLEDYLRQFPSGIHRNEAEAELANRREPRAWEAALTGKTVAAMDAFLKAYPNGVHREDARRARAELQDEAELARAAAGGKASLEAYIRTHTAGPMVEKADELLHSLLYDQFGWQECLDRDEEAAYQDYLKNYPKGQHAAEAQAILARIATWPAASVVVTTSGDMAESKDAKAWLQRSAELVLHQIGFRIAPDARSAAAQVRIEAFGSALDAEYDNGDGVFPLRLYTGAIIDGTVTFSLRGGKETRHDFSGSLDPGERGSTDRGNPTKAPFTWVPTNLRESVLKASIDANAVPQDQLPAICRRILQAARRNSTDRDALATADAALARLVAMGQATADDYLCCVRAGWYWDNAPSPATASLLKMGAPGRDAACALVLKSSSEVPPLSREQAVWVLGQYKGDDRAVAAIIQSAMNDEGNAHETDALVQQGPAALSAIRHALTDPQLSDGTRRALQSAERRLESKDR